MIHALFLLTLIAVYVTVDAISAQKNKKRNRIIAMAFLLFLFAALRSTEVGIDVPGYADFYELLYSYSFKQILVAKSGRDAGFYIFMKLLSYISLSPQLMLVVVGGIVAIAFAYFAYHQDGNDLLLFILFITLRLYPFTLTGLRQAVALSLCWIAFVKLQQGKNKTFIALVALAACSHLSALSFVFAFLLYKWGKPIIVALLSLAIAVADTMTGHTILQYLSSRLMGDRFEDYLDENAFTNFSGGGTFLIYLVFFALITFALLVSKKNLDNTQSYKKMFNVTCVTLMLIFLSQSIPVFFRISYYYILPFYALVSRGINAILSDKRDRFLVYTLIISLLCTQYVLLTPGAGINDYTFFWELSI